MPGTSLNPLTILLIAAALIPCACRRDPKPGTTHIQVGWRPVISLSGSGPSQTESFNIDTGQWRIKWVARSQKSPDSGTLRVTVHSAISGRPMMVAIDHKGAGHDVAYVNEDPRLYHLVVDSEGIDWSFAIEEAVVGY
jgi:hypothetical protein